MVHPPSSNSVTVSPATLQVAGVADAKLTAKPDDAVADTVNGGVPILRLGSGANVMVCASLVTWKPCVTGVAGAYLALPAWLACSVQRPTASSVTVFPETVQTGVVPDANLTGRPDVAVAVTENGAVPNGWFGKDANVIVWANRVTEKL
jgi:hypothetical protein